MTGLSSAAAQRGIISGANSMAKAGVPREELRAWAALAIGSLALAGIMAVLVAVSRIPGIQAFGLWPLDFFAKGLVIHVIFSLVVWFLTVFALLVSMATAEVGGEGVRFAALGGVGAMAAAAAYPLLFLTSFDHASAASLNNYIPVIQNRAYYDGLAILALAIAMPVLRLLLNIPARWKEMPPLPFAMSAGSIIYLIAMVCFGISTYLSWGATPSKEMNELLFWGGGHILQFLFCLLMLTGWFVLSRSSLGEEVIGNDSLRVAVLILLAFTLPGPYLFRAFDISSANFREAFSKLQFVMALPALMVGVPLLFGIARAKEKAPLPWRDPAFVALVLSMAVFGVGGVMGNLISGSDTRTPAHYHAVITGVSLAAVGLMLSFCLPALDRAPQESRWLRLQIWLYGGGQLFACIGMFLAGQHGAPRKTPTSLAALTDGAVIGMFLNGIGALIAVAGGVMFVVTVIRALSTRANAETASGNFTKSS
jgi:heme/copper-type cytochrome/quinol oxidase subunit 1